MSEISALFELERVYMKDCTLGVLYGPNGVVCNTLELAWRDNQVRVSCIREGTYQIVVGRSPKFGHCVRVTNVSGRSGILFHAANNPHLESGKVELAGCIAPCLSVSIAGDVVVGLQSSNAVKKFFALVSYHALRGGVYLRVYESLERNGVGI